ncbi:MAG: SAM-dependent methyltransferase [Verrucomicrobia bacterium]|nr:SAM-dependent methyltransferase [Verrucomicrobiota bacterium]
MSAGKLFLLPNLLDESLDAAPFLPANLSPIIQSLQGLIAESEKSGRRYLRRFLTHDQMAALPLKTLNEHSAPDQLEELLAPLKNGEIWGLISDAGLPCIADPGSDLVALARKHQIAIQAVPGPSSIILSLQLSGFNGQKFSFHGYLPREPDLLEKQIIELEKRSRAERSTQIWIEAPYRSSKMLEFLKSKLQPQTRLFVGVQLTTPSERTASLTIAEWRKTSFPIEKEPAVFLIFAH